MIRPAITATLDDLRRLAGELDEADKAIAAHVVRKATAILAAELERLSVPIPVTVHVDTPLVRPSASTRRWSS